MILVWTLLSFVLADSAITNSFLAPNQSLRDGDTLVSASGSFELGFFSPPSSSNRYLGIWYANFSPITAVWIANREVPLVNHFGVLNLTKQGTLTILDEKGKTLWSSEKPKATKNPVLQLLDSGNAVVQEESDSSSGNYSWQSFDYPSDTLLREMKLGRNFVTGLDWLISSWKSSDDPARGEFSAWIDPKGYPQHVVRRGNATHYRGGSWNGVSFTGTPEQRQVYELLKYEFEFNKNEVYYKWEPSSSLISRLVMNQSGFLERFFWIPQSKVWTSVYHEPVDQCDFYAVCGAYAICNVKGSKPLCGCLEGFGPKYPKEWKDSKWSSGCSRKVELNCANDVFRQYMGLKLPDTSTVWFNMSMSLVECKEKCARNCSCTAYAKSNISDGGSGCLLWFTDLIDMKVLGESGQDLFIRMSYSKGLSSRPWFSKKVLAAIICSMSVIMVLAGSIIYYQKKLRDKGGEDEIELQVFSLTQLAKATDNFSNNSMLGKGGFGPVYKGILPDKQEIAVKRLSRTSGQGMVELKNEVKLIAKLQHRNLVKLLGCCIHGDEKLLVYEYMPNKSLDHFIFDQTRSTLLDWPKRMQIVIGIARGLLYLHQDSRLRIIHRDLKASNILLDKDMNPKISDFGMARSFWADQTEANTNKVVGTYGYMSPEYAVDGLFSLKSDVFSFGVLVLELISGKKNRGFKHPEHDHNLLGHAWTLWMEDRVIGLIDSKLRETCLVSEVLRCIHVALLCVQQRPEDRPSMSSVVVMLGSETPLPKPRQPGFFQARNLPEADSSSSKHESVSTNELSISAFEPR